MTIQQVLITSGIASAIIAGVISIIILWLDKKYFSVDFEKRVAKYQHSLDSIAEQARFDYQKELSGFNIYVQKKHEIYSELNKFINIADGTIKYLRGEKYIPEFLECSKSEVEEYLIGLHVPKDRITPILELWDTARSSALREINSCLSKYFGKREAEEAFDAYVKVHNYYWFSAIYLSEEISNNAKLFIEKIKKLYDNYVNPDFNLKFRKECATIKEETDVLVKNIISLMKKELCTFETKKII